MGKGLNTNNIKKVLKSIRDGNNSYASIQKNTSISETSLTRILKDYLMFWGIISQSPDGLWIFSNSQIKYNSIQDYETQLKHSQELCRFFYSYIRLEQGDQLDYYGLSGDIDKIANIGIERNYVTLTLFREHLQKEYPRFWELIAEYKTLSEKNDFPPIHSLSNINLEPKNPKRPTERNWVKKYDIKTQIIDVDDETGEPVIISNNYLGPDIVEELEIMKSELIGRLANIFKGVRFGTPFNSKCSVCPSSKVTIGDE